MLTLVAVVTFTFFSWTQDDKSKRSSPPATASGKLGGATITIHYGSPSVKGRAIWGSLVPYNKAWRAGANKVTTLKQTKRSK